MTLSSLASGTGVGIILTAAALRILRAMRRASEPIHQTVFTLAAILPVLLLGMAGIYFLHFPVLANNYSTIAAVLIAPPTLLLTARFARMRFDPVIAVEETGSRAENLSNVKWSAYFTLSSLGLSVLLAFILFTIGTVPAENWAGGALGDYTGLVPLSGVLLFVVVALLGVAEVRRVRSPLPWMPWVVSSLLLAWGAMMVVKLFAGIHNPVQLIIGVIVTVISALFMFESIISNGAYLHNGQITGKVRLVATSVAIAVGLTTAWVIGPALASGERVEDVGSSLVSLVVGIVALMLLPRFAAGSLPGAHPIRQYAPASPLAGILQDSFVMLLLAICVGWLPNFILAHLIEQALWWSVVIAYLTMFSAAYVFVMKNNIGHARRERARLMREAARQGIPLPPDVTEALDSLDKHIVRQNRLGLAALIPLGLLVIFSEITGFDREGFRTLINV